DVWLSGSMKDDLKCRISGYHSKFIRSHVMTTCRFLIGASDASLSFDRAKIHNGIL
ncbi:hypothetical protein NPIL_489251, partial [Nephila pilipes]